MLKATKVGNRRRFRNKKTRQIIYARADKKGPNRFFRSRAAVFSQAMKNSSNPRTRKKIWDTLKTAWWSTCWKVWRKRIQARFFEKQKKKRMFSQQCFFLIVKEGWRLYHVNSVKAKSWLKVHEIIIWNMNCPISTKVWQSTTSNSPGHRARSKKTDSQSLIFQHFSNAFPSNQTGTGSVSLRLRPKVIRNESVDEINSLPNHRSKSGRKFEQCPNDFHAWNEAIVNRDVWLKRRTIC